MLIDLITVSMYRIGDSEVIVPQRVESERRPVEVPNEVKRTGPAAVRSRASRTSMPQSQPYPHNSRYPSRGFVIGR